MDASFLLRLPEGLDLIAITSAGDGVLLQVEATAERACCPLCHTCSTRVHSRYARTVTDLPCAGRRVRLRVQVRRFWCEHSECPRKLFAERLSPFIEPWARLTTRLCQAIQALGLATSGELGARLGDRLGIGTSPTTILRCVMVLSTPPPASVAALGIDDFALRRGRRYGTILVDLTRHHVIDLLPDRQTETAVAWMKQHPEIDLVSRDRGGDYATAATQAAPQAIQVADRFHIVKNLAEAVELTLAASRTELLQALQSNQEAPSGPLQANMIAEEEWHPQPDATAQAASLAKRAERYERYQQMLALSAQGLTMQEIARRLQISERTIQRWQKQGIFPERKRRRKQHSGLDPYLAYVISRLQSGCQNGRRLWRELQAQGFHGSERTVYRYLEALQHRKRHIDPEEVPPTPLQHFSSKEAVWWFIRAPADLKETERQELSMLCQGSPKAQLLYRLIQAFMQMVHHRRGEQLDAWLQEVRASPFPSLQRFVTGIERDKAVVLAGLTLQPGNAQTEGHVCKLKMIKRVMFGRAGFPLLRQRVLHAV